MKRILTTVVLLPIALAAVFYLSALWFWIFAVGLVAVAAWECVGITRRWAPMGPRWLLMVTVPAASALLGAALWEGVQPETMWSYLLGLLFLLSVVCGALALVGKTPVDEAIGLLGILGWGTAYFSVAAVSIWALQVMGPQVLLLLLAVVWLGDSAAYYVGKSIGRHPLAPVVSPNKTWEGSAASLLAGVAAAAVWSQLVLGGVRWQLVAVAAAAGAIGQLGDLVESMIKRGAGVKDSGNLLPGHGGMWDRLDALLFAGPALLLGLWLIGFDAGALR